MSQLTDAGLEIDSFEDIVAGIKAELRSELGASLDLGDETPDGVLINIVSDRIADVGELVQAVYSAVDADAATGASQDAIGALTGTPRLGATRSTVDLLFIGDVATSIAALTRASDPATGSIWESIETASLIACAPWAINTAYTAGQVRSNANRIYLCITSGTSAGAGGPTTTSADITDNTAHWRYLGEGLGVIASPSRCTVDGPTVAAAYEITEIDTPISGLNAVINLLDATPGRLEETGEAYRTRREAGLAGAAKSIPDAIRSDLLDIDEDNVLSVTVFYNPLDDEDADGIPGHCVEPLVRTTGAVTDQMVYDQLMLSVAAGIRTHGTLSGTATDSQGTAHDFKFTRPTEIDVYIIITVDIDADTYPADGDDQVKAAIVAYGDTLGIGRDIRARPLGSAAMAVAGVIDAPEVLIGIAALPTLETTIAVGLREVAIYDTSRITVVQNPVTP